MKIEKQDMTVFIRWAIIWAIAMTIALKMPLGLHAQALNCNGLVTMDQAEVFNNLTEIEKAASSLIDQGADVHIVSLTSVSPLGLIGNENSLEAACPSWLSGGKRKPNLFVLFVSPAGHKKNAFFGGAYTPALPTQDSVNVLYSQASNLFFKQGDFSGGMAAALRDFGANVAAYHDQQKHPIQQVVNNEATDLSGFWKVLGWGLFLVATVLVIFGIFAVLASRRRRREEIAKAQTSAISARDVATKLYRSYNPTPELSARLVDLNNSIKSDPTVDGLTIDQYLAIRDVWNDFANDCKPFSPKAELPWNFTAKTTHHHSHSHLSSNPTPNQSTPYPTSPSYAAQPSAVVVNQSSDNGLLTGILIGEELDRHSERVVYEDRPVYREPEPRYDPPSSSGSDSGWGSSSDSGSSGSDSSYSDSSSSDSGSGSDSGW
jgi:uncharacterized membrane protein YgcG